MGACYEHLSYVDRLSIDEGCRARLSLRAIARKLNRAPSTISRELKRMGPYWQNYAPAHALSTALRRRSEGRSGTRKLIPGSPLFEHVAGQLRTGWSPLQIAGRLRRMEPATCPGTVCHETIYTALYALPRGELRRELLGHLRQGRQNRRPRSRGTDRRKGFVTDDIRISERPEEIAGRLIPGHWEGDLIKGAANRSAVGTLVERTSRLVLLARMDGLDSDTTCCAFERSFENIPEPMRKTLTYDRGTEMARHAKLTANTGIKVYFADPYSPWQRGSNENANGLIRQYLPKGTDLSGHSQDELNIIAERLNNRPRKVLNFLTPNEVFAALVADAQSTGQQCCASA
jgi:transposase, IS30 family